MINLLPPTEKKEQKENKLFLKILDLELLFFAFLIFLTLIFFLILIRFQVLIKEKEVFLSLKNKELILYQEIEKDVDLFNSLTSKVKSILKSEKKATPILEKIISLSPEGISLENISFTLEKDKNYFQVNLYGFASDRTDLVLLKLKLEENFKEVSFSPESWVKPTDINFSVSFKAE